MANTKVSALTSLAAVPASGDLIPIVDVSDTTHAASGTTKKIAASFFAFLAQAQTFSAAQTIEPSDTGSNGLTVNMPASTSGTSVLLQYNNTNRGSLAITASSSVITLNAFDNGSSNGTNLILGRNSNASTPAAGFVTMTNLGNTNYRIWPDTSGNLRIHTAAPTNANDTAGTVVGAQTSHVAFKDVTGDPVSNAEALALLRAAAAQVKRFIYTSGAYNNQEFSGLILDGETLHRYGQDADAEHPAGKSLNVVNAIGDLLLAIDNLAGRVETLEAA